MYHTRTTTNVWLYLANKNNTTIKCSHLSLFNWHVYKSCPRSSYTDVCCNNSTTRRQKSCQAGQRHRKSYSVSTFRQRSIHSFTQSNCDNFVFVFVTLMSQKLARLGRLRCFKGNWWAPTAFKSKKRRYVRNCSMTVNGAIICIEL